VTTSLGPGPGPRLGPDVAAPSGSPLHEPRHDDAALGLDVAARAQWRLALRRFRRHKLAMTGLAFLALMVVLCFVGAEFAQDPTEQHLLEPTSGPSADHWFGTDEISRDLFSRVLHGGRISLVVGLGVALISSVLGSAVGAVAGFYGGRLDNVLMRLVDLVLTVPALPLLVVAASIGEVGPVRLGSPLGITLILSLLFWTQIARVVRGVFLSLREKEFVEAARALGASDTRIIVRHVIPNALGPIIVNTTLAVAVAILTESALSFLGFGVQPPTPTWGNLLSNAITTMELYPWLTVFPGLAIFLTGLAISFVGDGLRDALDPTQKRVRA
jgi:peptide/nickel transport system permease protein